MTGARPFTHSGDGLADLCSWLGSMGEPPTIAIAIEVPHGAVVETLLERGFVVFSIRRCSAKQGNYFEPETTRRCAR